MKNYTITVNGNVYEVTVEEGFTGAASAPKAAAPAPKAHRQQHRRQLRHRSSSGSSGWRSRRSSSYSSDAG